MDTPYANNYTGTDDVSSTAQALWILVPVYEEPESEGVRAWKVVVGSLTMVLGIAFTVLRVRLRYRNCSEWDRRSRRCESVVRLPTTQIYQRGPESGPVSVIHIPPGPSLLVDQTSASYSSHAPPLPPPYVTKLPASAPPTDDVSRGTRVEDHPPKYDDAVRTLRI